VTLTIGPIVSGSQVGLFEPEYEGQVNFKPEQIVLNIPLVTSDGNPTDFYFGPPEGCLVLFVRIRHVDYQTFETLTAPHGIVEVDQQLDTLYPVWHPKGAIVR